MRIKYNDNELLYLISEYDEYAFELLCEKYKPLIINRLKKFRIQAVNFDDYYQECLMVLYSCCENYREDKCYTFNIYLDVSIQNKIRNLLRKDHNYFYNVSLLELEVIDGITFKEKSEFFENDNEILYENIKNSFEKKVMKLYLSGNNIKDIARLLSTSVQRVYYIISKYRPKERYKAKNIWNGVFSNLENQVYELYSRSCRPREIAKFLNCDIGTIYNAIKRIKSKSK